MKTNVVNVKKITAVAVAFLLMILSVSYSGNKSDAANTARTYRIFNAKTGAKIGSDYTLDALPAEDNSRSIIDDDERVIDWTKSGVVKLMSSNDYIGSGFVVSDHVIATAAHCAYDKLAKKGLPISEILLFDNSGNVTMNATPVQSHIPVDYINNLSDNVNLKYENYDYALITVKEDLSAYACFNLGVPLDSFVNGNSAVTVTGFPGDYNTNTTHMKYSSNGIICGGDNSLIYYSADTTGGNSGGPVYLTESAYGRTYYTVVAIHAYRPHKNNNIDHTAGNHGTRITTDLIHFYKRNPNIQ